MKIVFKLLLSSVLIAAIFADEFDSRTKEANYDGYVILPPKMGNSNNCIFFSKGTNSLEPIFYITIKPLNCKLGKKILIFGNQLDPDFQQIFWWNQANLKLYQSN